MLFFKFFNQSLQELLLSLHLFYFGFDLESDTLLHTTFMLAISTNLREKLHVAHRAEQESPLVKALAELLRALFFGLLLSVCFPRCEKLLHASESVPIVHPATDYLIVAIPLCLHLAHLEFFLCVNGVQLAKFRTFLTFKLFNALG